MNTRLRRLVCTSLATLGLVLFALNTSHAADKLEPATTGSIRPSGHVHKSDLPSLAKLSFEQALHAALAAVPGHVIKAELEVEHGDLMYSFEIVNADKKVIEVEIDAGNGRVLDIDED